MVRRAIRSGQLTWRKSLISTGLVLLGYLILVPAAALYEKHPECKPLFIAAAIATAADFLFLLFLGLRWWKQGQAQQS